MVTAIPVNLPHHLHVTDEQFLQFVSANPDLRLERTAAGQLIVMPPTGSEGGHYNAELNTDIGIWNRQVQSGKIFDSSTGFRLPNGALRSPDVAWVARDRWNALTLDQRKGFAPLCPDFVIELASETDTLEDIQSKMLEYIENGCRLGWLINPKTKTVAIYRPGQPIETVPFSSQLSGEDVMPGLCLQLQALFQD